MTAPEIFGQDTNGSAVQRITLSGGGLTVKLLSWGCVVQDLRLSGHAAPLVLGFEDFDPYLHHSPFFGATAGRFANRIRNGRFDIDGIEYRTDRNFLGKHTLHGGAESLGTRNWRFASVDGNSATLEIMDPDGKMGFPGTCRFRAIFSLPGEGRLLIRYESETDRATPVSLAHHSYFNLSEETDIANHELQILADHYLPVDDEAIPLGKPRSVEGTHYDFLEFRQIASIDTAESYDHNYCLSTARRKKQEVARLRSSQSKIVLRLSTTEPGLQFYDGHMIDIPVPGLDGRSYGARAGLCLEPQIWPDAPNRPGYPSSILRPGELYVQETELQFSKIG